MAGVLQHLRSSTLNKRPNPSSMVDGQVAINYASGAPGMFFKDSNGALVKVGPVHVGSGAPNAVPASGGTAGNSLGEQWLDTSGGTYVFKIWDGSAWRSEAGEFVNVTGDTMTGALGIIAGSASTPGLFIGGDANSGLYSPGADQVAISTNGTGRLFVNSNGDIGLGTSSPENFAGFTTQTINGSTGSVLAFQNGGTAGTARFVKTNTIFSMEAVAAIPLVFNTNNTERMRLDSSGRLGLGTSSPNELLEVTGNIHMSGAVDRTIFNRANNALSLGTNNTNRLYISSGGDVAVGGLLPQGRLHVWTKGIITEPTYNSTAEAPGIVLNVWNKGGGSNFETVCDIVAHAQNQAGPRPSQFRFFTAPDSGNAIPIQRMVIDSAGRVGIGTTSPSAGLAVRRGVADASYGNLSFEASDNVNNTLFIGHGTNITRLVFDSTAAIAFNQATSERLRVDTSGRLLVGTSSGFGNSVFTKAEFVNSASYTNIVVGRTDGASGSGSTIGTISFLSNAGGAGEYHASIAAEMDAASGSGDKPGRLVFSTTADGASSPTERMRITAAGRMLLNTTSESTPANGQLSIDAAMNNNNGIVIQNTDTQGAGQFFAIFYNSAGNTAGSISHSGTTAVAFNTSSDYRLKENVVPLIGAVDRVKQLKPSQFNFITDPGKTVDGFLAHEAQAVVPECVTGIKDEVDADGKPIYQGIDQSKLVPLLTAALQEALQKIETLEQRLNDAGIA
jgi:hypothetical protein